MDITDDWRLIRGQDEYLRGLTFRKTRFVTVGTYDHDHCEFCWEKFMEDCSGIAHCSSEGYLSMDGKFWVCQECFDDFKEILDFHLIGD